MQTVRIPAHWETILNSAVFAVVLLIAALARLWAAPLSAGPDVAQFRAIARHVASRRLGERNRGHPSEDVDGCQVVCRVHVQCELADFAWWYPKPDAAGQVG